MMVDWWNNGVVRVMEVRAADTKIGNRCSIVSWPSQVAHSNDLRDVRRSKVVVVSRESCKVCKVGEHSLLPTEDDLISARLRMSLLPCYAGLRLSLSFSSETNVPGFASFASTS